MIHSTLGKNILVLDEFNLLVSECTMLINKRPLNSECGILRKDVDKSALVLTPEILLKGYEIPSVRILPVIDNEDSNDPPFISNPNSIESKLLDSFDKLCKIQQNLRTTYFDGFIRNLMIKSVDTKSRFVKQNHIMLSVGDFVAVKSKLTKPYAYPVGIVTAVELNNLEEVNTVSIRKANGEIIRRHVTDIILLEAACADNKIDKKQPSQPVAKPFRRSKRIAAKHSK